MSHTPMPSSSSSPSPRSANSKDELTSSNDSPDSHRHQTTLLHPSLPSSLRSSTSLRTPKAEVTPVSIRSAVAFGAVAANFDEKKKSFTKFVPNIQQTTSGNPFGSLLSAKYLKSEPTTISNELDMSSVLAHSLSLKNLQQGGTRHLQELHLRKASAPGGGAFSARNSGDKRIMSVQAKVQQHLQNIRKKKMGKKSIDMLELSWAQGPSGIPLYTPITLPYVTVMDDEKNDETNDGTRDASTIRASRRPTSRLIDESNRQASQLFDDNNEDEFSDAHHQWLFIQLPSVLPALDQNAPLLSPSDLDGKTPSPSLTKTPCVDGQYWATNLEGLPEGRLGLLKIHRSGKVTFVMGGQQFDVNQGTDCNFAQEVACFVEENSELMFLGRCNKRIIVTPDLSQIPIT